MRTQPSWRAAGAPLYLFGVGAALFCGAAAGWLAQRREHERLHRALVELLLNTLSAGDVPTAQHCRRVADLTDALADTYRLRRTQRTRLRLAALLHDVGKIDDRFFHIVHSRSPLSPEERRKIKHHPHESAYILEPLEEIHCGIMEIVCSHHESWDGGGYPRGLRGTQIPLEARIIAVADAFDALTQERPYQAAMSVGAALLKLREGAGTRFDPEVVSRLERPRLLARWRRIVREGRAEQHQAAKPPRVPAIRACS